jgi:predicted nucleic acid-binding protein
MRLALDTNRYSDFWAGVADVVRTLELAEQIYVPFAVVAELRSGFLNGTRAAENERALQTFLRKPGISMLLADDLTTIHYASISHQLRIQGTPIPINDVWIAAIAMQHGLTLYARDKHFDHIPQLVRV